MASNRPDAGVGTAARVTPNASGTNVRFLELISGTGLVEDGHLKSHSDGRSARHWTPATGETCRSMRHCVRAGKSQFRPKAPIGIFVRFHTVEWRYIMTNMKGAFNRMAGLPFRKLAPHQTILAVVTDPVFLHGAAKGPTSRRRTQSWKKIRSYRPKLSSR